VPDEASTIQAGIDSASAGDTVSVACGTYYENAIEMKPGIYLRSETGQPNCVTIDGRSLGRIFDCVDVDANTVIQGLTMTGGTHPPGAPFADRKGGAISCLDSSPTVVNSVFHENAVDNQGGAIYCAGYSGLELSNVVFVGNSASGGGAIAADNISAVTLYDCEFFNNSATGTYGGAIKSWGSWIDATGCVFAGNSAGNVGGGIAAFEYGALVLSSCTFYGNSAYEGGGIYCNMDTYPVEITNTIISFSSETITGFRDPGPAYPVYECLDIYGNGGGDWVEALAPFYGVNGNFSENPLFCDAASDDYGLVNVSPCAPGNHPDCSECGLIGARPVDCTTSGIGSSQLTATTWGRMKSMYR
jgi:predicted outer membrane repeat protein